MPALVDSYSAAQTVVVLEPGVLRDVAHTLTGLWRPTDEGDDDGRRRQLLATARLRLYGAPADRSAWHLTTTDAAHARAEELGDVEWSAGFIPSLESYDDAPAAADVQALAQTLRSGGIEAEAATTLALGELCDQVGVIVARDPKRYRHNRTDDLPRRLRILDPVEAVRGLGLQVGEPAPEPPPEGHLLAGVEPWWVPVVGEADLVPDGDPPSFER